MLLGIVQHNIEQGVVSLEHTRHYNASSLASVCTFTTSCKIDVHLLVQVLGQIQDGFLFRFGLLLLVVSRWSAPL
jgi:hypothetical protein